MAFASISFSFISKYYLQPLFLIIFYVNLLCLFQYVRATSNETDYLALLRFKESITDDPKQILSSWNSSNHFCNWTGITCSRKHQRVTELNLEGYNLGGIISPHVGYLSFLRNLSLTLNSFHGEIPPELGRLFRLRTLSLSNNTLTGEILWNLTSCTQLRILHLSGNRLIGKIPYQLGSLQKLETLRLSFNNLSGEIPLSIWNLTSLTHLAIGQNNLEGSIPEEIGNLNNLEFFSAAVNALSGTLPSSLYNLSALTVMSLGKNNLNITRLPSNMFSNLPNLEYFAIGLNQISGPIPHSIINASSLQLFNIPSNNFFGQVPNLGDLQDLRSLNLEFNNFGSSSNSDLSFMTSLENCSKLEVLSLTANKFGGILPNSIGNLSTQLTLLYLGSNQIYGTVPDTLGKYTILNGLGLEDNKFSGTIPTSFGNLREIKRLLLEINQLSGEIPASLGNLSELIVLTISENMLEGKIPITVGNMKSLQLLDLSNNNLNGSIPLQIFGLSSLSIFLNLSHNSFDGSLPVEVGMLKNLGTLDISENNLSGEVPSTIGECTSMEYLNLLGNSFNGPMPPSLALMKGLTHLDISRNNLSGSLLIGLQNISLQYLNVSFNRFDGEVPTEGVFSNASTISVIGNTNLCGGISDLQLSPCPKKVDTQRKHNLKLVVIVICVTFPLLVILLLAFYWRRERNKKSSTASPEIEQFHKVSYQNLHIATRGFSTSNLIGSGSSGSVYKGRLLEPEDKVVAIKVLDIQKKRAEKNFILECNALKNIRHRNLVKILTCCSSIDYKGQEFKALVYEYMSNGSLEKWLHSEQESGSTLDIRQRLDIVCDVASALHYLHYENEQPIVHCDIKPSNILLDDDMVSHVSDFGLARLLATLSGNSQKQMSTSGIKGTIGYTPPEYGISSEVSTQGDVYSFGILILEMLTGRRPTDIMFEDGHNLHSYTKAAFPNNLLEIIDTALVPHQIQQTTTVAGREIRMEEVAITIHPKHEKTLISLFEMGLACSVESPKERVNMMGVLRELNQIKTVFDLGETSRN